MVRNRLRSSRRAEREEPFEEDNAVDEELLVHLKRAQRIAAVRDAILALPERYREVVLLCEIEECNYAAACLAAWTVFPRATKGPQQTLPPPQSLAVFAVATKAPPAPATWSRFVPLAEIAMLPDPGVIQLLRASVSRDRLSYLGVIPPGTGDDFEIPAQVLLGDDGMARAIRVAYNR